MRIKSIVAAAEKAFVNNTSGFFLRQEELGATRRGDTGFSKGPRLLPAARYRRNQEYSTIE